MLALGLQTQNYRISDFATPISDLATPINRISKLTVTQLETRIGPILVINILFFAYARKSGSAARFELEKRCRHYSYILTFVWFSTVSREGKDLTVSSFSRPSVVWRRSRYFRFCRYFRPISSSIGRCSIIRTDGHFATSYPRNTRFPGYRGYQSDFQVDPLRPFWPPCFPFSPLFGGLLFL